MPKGNVNGIRAQEPVGEKIAGNRAVWRIFHWTPSCIFGL